MGGHGQAGSASKWNKRVSEVFFTDAREKLVGDARLAEARAWRWRLPARPRGLNAGPGASAGGTFAWSNLISSDTLETEVKSLQKEVSDTVQTPAQFKGGGYKDGPARVQRAGRAVCHHRRIRRRRSLEAKMPRACAT